MCVILVFLVYIVHTWLPFNFCFVLNQQSCIIIAGFVVIAILLPNPSLDFDDGWSYSLRLESINYKSNFFCSLWKVLLCEKIKCLDRVSERIRIQRWGQCQLLLGLLRSKEASMCFQDWAHILLVVGFTPINGYNNESGRRSENTKVRKYPNPFFLNK